VLFFCAGGVIVNVTVVAFDVTDHIIFNCGQ